MKTQNLYRTLVVGSGALLVGCAASKSVEKSAEPTQNEAVSASEQGGNAAKTTEAAPPTEINPTRPDGKPLSEKDNRCNECEGDGRSMLCPDPTVGGMNCCWLMSSPQHPCCP